MWHSQRSPQWSQLTAPQKPAPPPWRYRFRLPAQSSALSQQQHQLRPVLDSESKHSGQHSQSSSQSTRPQPIPQSRYPVSQPTIGTISPVPTPPANPSIGIGSISPNFSFIAATILAPNLSPLEIDPAREPSLSALRKNINPRPNRNRIRVATLEAVITPLDPGDLNGEPSRIQSRDTPATSTTTPAIPTSATSAKHRGRNRRPRVHQGRPIQHSPSHRGRGRRHSPASLHRHQPTGDDAKTIPIPDADH